MMCSARDIAKHSGHPGHPGQKPPKKVAENGHLARMARMATIFPTALPTQKKGDRDDQ